LLKRVSMPSFISSSKLVYFPFFISMNLASIFLIDFHKNSFYIFTNEDSWMVKGVMFYFLKKKKQKERNSFKLQKLSTFSHICQFHLCSNYAMKSRGLWYITLKIDASQLQYDNKVILHLVSFVLQNSPLA
jgi:hypothetical protein